MKTEEMLKILCCLKNIFSVKRIASKLDVVVLYDMEIKGLSPKKHS
jgi:hypothetical protein